MKSVLANITATQVKVFTTDAIAAVYPHCATWVRLLVIGIVTSVYTAANTYYKTRASHSVGVPPPQKG